MAAALGTGSGKLYKVLNQDDYLMNPGRSGYTFLGWTYDATHTFTAQWEAITYTVTFDANGGEGAPWTQTFQAGVTKALSKNAFTKDEAVFVGWSTEKDGGDEGWALPTSRRSLSGIAQQSDSVRSGRPTRIVSPIGGTAGSIRMAASLMILPGTTRLPLRPEKWSM